MRTKILQKPRMGETTSVVRLVHSFCWIEWDYSVMYYLCVVCLMQYNVWCCVDYNISINILSDNLYYSNLLIKKIIGVFCQHFIDAIY